MAATTGGTITQSGAVTVDSTSSFTTDVADKSITLNNTSNALTGAVTFTSTAGSTASNVTIDNGTTDLILAGTTIRGTLSATSGGTITQSGALTVDSTSSFTTDVNDKAITLSNTSNVFTGAVSFTTQSAGGNTGNVTIDNGTTNLIFGASTTAGSLTATSGGTITQSGALTVGSTSSFTTDVANQSITLSNTSNALTGAVSLSTSGTADATLDNGTTALDLGTVNIGQNLVVTAGNAITDSGVITVAGTASFTTDVSNNAITLDSTNVITGAVSFTTTGTGGDVTLDNGSTALNLGTISTGGFFSGTTTSSIATSSTTNTGEGLTLNANAGITLNNNITSTGATVIDADVDNNGVGDFTIAASQTLTSNSNSVTITSNDISLSGSIDAGTSSVTLNISDNGTIGVGATAGNWTLSGAELQNITAGTMTIGDTNDGAVAIDGITDANSQNISSTLLINSGGSATVSSASTFNVISIDALGGITVSGDLTSDTGDMTLDANTGTLTVAGQALNATGGSSNVTITADAVDLQAGSSITGSDTFTIQASTAGTSIGIAGGAGTLNLDATEFGYVTAANFSSVVIGASGATGSVGFSPTPISKSLTIRGSAITLAALDVTGSFTLDVNGGGANSITVTDAITATTGITFTADDDIIFNSASADLTTTTGGISLTADSDSDANGTGGKISMVDGVIIDGGSGDIALSADEDISLGRLVTTSSSNTAVVLTSTSGGIIDNGDAGSPDIEAKTGRLVIDVVTGIGNDGSKGANAADDAIDIQVASIDVDNTTSGNVNFNETDDISVIKINNQGGDVTVSTPGNLSNEGNITASGTITVGDVEPDPFADGVCDEAEQEAGLCTAPVVEVTPVIETVVTPVVETVLPPTIVPQQQQADFSQAIQSTFVSSFTSNGSSSGGGC